jgi:hypothetical protein
VGPPLEQQGWIEDVCFSPDGQQLATASSEGSVRLWSVDVGELLGPVISDDNPLELEYTRDGKHLAIAGSMRSGARLLNVPAPFQGGLEQLEGDFENAELWLQVLTRMKMDANGVLSRLDRATWQDRRDQLDSIRRR